MKTCVACQQQLPDDALFCGFCGFRLTPMPVTVREDGISGQGRTASVDGAEQAPILLTQPKSLDRSKGARQVAPSSSANPSPQPTGESRRADRRFPLKVDVTYQSEHNFYTGFTQNVSSGGLFVATHGPSSLGDALRVTFTIPGLPRNCEASCEVVWVREYDPSSPEMTPGMGLRFVDLDPDVAVAVDTFIGHREPIFFEE